MSYIAPMPVTADPADALLATPIEPGPRWPGDDAPALIQRINHPFGPRLGADAVTAIPTGRTNA
ncbi:hypothetical protein [Azospirillum agricola]|uniref:hypothetical protein n=1 Tax=Azospirillum agricola TaxID=1720247 RepID=UPI000A0F1068|nr:hypothetical protein [Azospirillum agricola]SMH29487.1 hypothetical protein SAMN02982994_0183 [Azospirillum lipoferum]